MDPFTAAVLGLTCSVAANALTSLVAHVSNMGAKAREHRDTLRRRLEEDTTLRSILERAAVSLARAVCLDDKNLAAKLRVFLVSPDIESILRQLYAASIMPGSGSALDRARAELRATLCLYLADWRDRVDELRDFLFDSLLGACKRALDFAIEDGVLSAHEAMSSLRGRVLQDQLAAIDANLRLLTSGHHPQPEAIRQFEKDYRSQVASRHRHIVPPDFDAARRVPIDDIFVSPSFVGFQRPLRADHPVLAMEDLLASTYRLVVLGDPGGGKSTFAVKVCRELAVAGPDAILPGRDVTPILVLLRDYGAQKKTQSCSILQFIESTARSKYQVDPPTGAFEYMLLNGRAYVVFDGLDELLDTSYRQDIAGDIEAFCDRYPSVPALVTSRHVGYNRAPLDEQRFEVYRLAPFSDPQVEEYARKWFATYADYSTQERNAVPAAFVRESNIAPDLRSNPLMLALMCNTYRGEGYMPRNRVDLYEKCATMLFERWDKSRGIHVTLPFEAHVRPAIQDLAHWIYQDESRQAGILPEAIVARAAKYLLGRRFETEEEAQAAAREFVEWCTGRAWVFSDTGTTPSGTRIYQFTHRTFMEYFCAAHLVRIHRAPAALFNALAGRIAHREWDAVAQLAFHLQSRDVEGASDELLRRLLDAAGGASPAASAALLSFAARCLVFVVPSPTMTREVVLACVAFCRSGASEAASDRAIREWPAEALGALAGCADENRSVALSAFERCLEEGITAGLPDEVSRLCEIAFHYPSFVGPSTRATGEAAFLDSWRTVSERLWEKCGDGLLSLAERDPKLTIWPYWTGRMSIADVAQVAGVNGLFAYPELRLADDCWLAGPAVGLVYGILDRPTEPPDDELLRTELRAVATVLASEPPPWVRRETLGGLRSPTPIGFFVLGLLLRPGSRVGVLEAMELDGNALFGLACTLAVICEHGPTAGGSGVGELTGGLSTAGDQWPVRVLLLARLKPTSDAEIGEALDTCGFSPEQREIIARWISNDINLIAG